MTLTDEYKQEVATKVEPERSLTMSVLMTPDMVNFSGNIHGGHILKLLDQVAYACASQYAGSYVVTLSVDKVLFRAPVYLAEILTFQASVNYTGTSSMEIGIRVVAQNVQTREERHTGSCYFTMIAKDENGRSKKVPELVLRNETEKRRFNEAKARREKSIKESKEKEEKRAERS